MADTLESIRQRRCPGCAPGFGTGAECRHHWLASRPAEQLKQSRAAQMRRAMRSTVHGINEHLKATYSQPIAEMVGLDLFLRLRGF